VPGRWARTTTLIGVLAAVAAGLPASPSAAADVPAATLIGTGAWCWFADPRAIAWGGRVVFGAVDGEGSIRAVDDLGRAATLDARLERDDHDSPSLHVGRDGRLTAFWSAHNGDAIRIRTTTGTSDLARWGPVRTGPANPPLRPGSPGARRAGATGFSYPTPIDAGGRLWLFWAGAGRTATYATSTDDGATWSPARSLFDPDATSVRYVKYAADGDAIHLAWTLAHPRDVVSRVHHAVIRGDAVLRQDGTRIGTLGVPLDPAAGDEIVPAGPAGRGGGAASAGTWVHDLAVRDGRPVIAYAAFASIADHRYHWATWDGRRWRDEELTAAGPSFEGSGAEPAYSGGIALDDADPAIAYLSRAVAGRHELERWTRTRDGWTVDPLTRGSSAPNVRPFPVAGGLAWMRGDYPSYTAFRTALVWRPAGTLAPVGAAGAPVRAEAARITRARLRIGQRLTVRTSGARRGLTLRLTRATAADPLVAPARAAATRRLAGSAGRLRTTVPRLRPGRYRASVWCAGRRLAWRTVTLTRR